MRDKNCLPQSFMEKYLPEGQTTKMFNIPIPDLTRDELIATIGFLANESKEHMRSMEFIRTTLSVARR